MRQLKFRCYWIDENGNLHKIPVSRYQRIFQRTEPIRLFSAKTVNFMIARVQAAESSQEELVGADFPAHTFDGEGLWCHERKMQVFRGASKMLSCGGNEAWQELYRYEYLEPHQWKPTELDLEKLKELIRARKKHS